MLRFACGFFGIASLSSDEGALAPDPHRWAFEVGVQRIRWLGLILILGFALLFPSTNRLETLVLAVVLALGNLGIERFLRSEPSVARLAAIQRCATILEWVVGVGVIARDTADPFVASSGLLGVLIVFAVARFGRRGFVGALAAAMAVALAVFGVQALVVHAYPPIEAGLKLGRAAIFLTILGWAATVVWEHGTDTGDAISSRHFPSGDPGRDFPIPSARKAVRGIDGPEWVQVRPNGYAVNDSLASLDLESSPEDDPRGVALPSLDRSLGRMGRLNRVRPTLSPRERDLLPFLAQADLTYLQIGSRMGLTEDTVKSHVHRMSHKLGVSGRHGIVDLARAGLAGGLIHTRADSLPLPSHQPPPNRPPTPRPLPRPTPLPATSGASGPTGSRLLAAKRRAVPSGKAGR